MASFDYTYTPIFGVENYIDNSGIGGAQLTDKNLVVSAWLNPTDVSAAQAFAGAELIRPDSANDNPAISATQRAASGLAFQSRCSARFHYLPVEDDPVTLATIALVLNPPAEYKQQMAGALIFNGGDPNDLATWTVKKSLQGNYAWFDAAVDASQGRNSTVVGLANNLPYSAYRSTYLQGLYAESNALAFLKTNGADGAVPESFDPSTAQGAQEMVAAVNKGHFYVAFIALVAAETDMGPFYFDVKWPHSIARG